MEKLSLDQFSLICFLVLMENGEGISDKAPDYIKEKRWVLDAGDEAFTALDIHNMRKVKAWCDKWNVEMPKNAANLLKHSEEAAEELKNRGFDLGL